MEIHLGRDFCFVLYLVEILLLDPFNLLAYDPVKDGTGGSVVVDKIKLLSRDTRTSKRLCDFPGAIFSSGSSW